MQTRLHSWMYNLLYPTLLGTFLVTMLIQPPNPRYMTWGVPLAIYFSLQHLEGSLDRKTYGLDRFAVDFVEMVTMSAAFASLYPGTLLRVDPLLQSIKLQPVLLFVFALPPIFRSWREKEKSGGFYKSLTAMSWTAFGSILLWWLHVVPEVVPYVLICLLLVVYASVFVLFNDRLPASLAALKRPADDDSRGGSG